MHVMYVCSRTVELLAAECGCPLEHPIAVKFRSYVMDGDWDQVINSSIIILIIHVVMCITFSCMLLFTIRC